MKLFLDCRHLIYKKQTNNTIQKKDYWWLKWKLVSQVAAAFYKSNTAHYIFKYYTFNRVFNLSANIRIIIHGYVHLQKNVSALAMWKYMKYDKQPYFSWNNKYFFFLMLYMRMLQVKKIITFMMYNVLMNISFIYFFFHLHGTHEIFYLFNKRKNNEFIYFAYYFCICQFICISVLNINYKWFRRNNFVFFEIVIYNQ